MAVLTRLVLSSSTATRHGSYNLDKALQNNVLAVMRQCKLTCDWSVRDGLQQFECHQGEGRTGSKMPGPSLLVLAEGSIPRLPVSMDAASDRMSPKMLPVTMVSKDLGFLMICMAALSTYLQTYCMLIASPHVIDGIAKAGC